MEIKRPHAAELIKKFVPPLAVWAVGALLERPQVASAVDRLDHNISKGQRRASRNAAEHRLILVAGVAAVAVGIGLIAAASSKKK